MTIIFLHLTSKNGGKLESMFFFFFYILRRSHHKKGNKTTSATAWKWLYLYLALPSSSSFPSVYCIKIELSCVSQSPILFSSRGTHTLSHAFFFSWVVCVHFFGWMKWRQGWNGMNWVGWWCCGERDVKIHFSVFPFSFCVCITSAPPMKLLLNENVREWDKWRESEVKSSLLWG